MDIERTQTRAVELFSAGYNCAQAAFVATAPEFGMDEASAIKVSAAFGGGIARSGNICGALSGALMALGLKRAPIETSPEIKAAVYARSQKMIAAFAERCGAVDCRDLSGCDLTTPEGAAQFASRGVHKNVCEGLVRTAIALVAES